MTILTGLLIMSGLIILMFGLLGDIFLAFHRETTAEIRNLREQLNRIEHEKKN